MDWRGVLVDKQEILAKFVYNYCTAPVAELEYAQRLGRCPERVGGSNPPGGTNTKLNGFSETELWAAQGADN